MFTDFRERKGKWEIGRERGRRGERESGGVERERTRHINMRETSIGCLP